MLRMNTRSLFLIIFSFYWITLHVSAQNIPVTPSETGAGIFQGETRPLRDIPELTVTELQFLKSKAEAKQLNKKLRVREYPYASIALPKKSDAVWQKNMGKSASGKAPERNFDGQITSSYPPDCNGTSGANHFMQTINTTYAIYDKAGTKLAGPTSLEMLFNGVSGADCNDGDPVIIYDEQADRWVACEFSVCGTNDRMLISVSTSNDPTGTWFAYSFDVSDVPDYPKLSVWQDGYYMGDNNDIGNDIYVFERSQMLIGAPNPKFVGFNNAWRPGSADGFMCVPPVDNEGAFAPAGSPGLFIAMSDDAFNGGTDQLWIYELAVNWSRLTSSTFNRVQKLDVAPFDSNFGNDWYNIKQLGTTQELDAIPQVIMNVPQYRNFGTYQTLVCCHTVDVDKTDHAGIRWYELRKTPRSTSWVVRQQGTYAPDIHSRWMGSIMLNGNDELGLGYSISSSTLNPGIRYCGQTKTEYQNASGILDLPEEIVHAGTVSQTGAERWGDYSQMSVDPVDDGTFWFTTEYAGSGSRKTKITSFQVGPVLPTAYFTANDTLPCMNNSIVSFTSQATGSPTQYLWEFTPATVTFTDGTSSSSVNPKIIFNAVGNYTVSLVLTGEGGTNATTKTDYIHVNEANPYFTTAATTVVVDNYTTFTDASTCGANTWFWDFGAGATPATATNQGPHSVSYNTTGPKTVSLSVNGNSTLTKTGYINVIDSNINMSSVTVAACSGTFFDPGGLSANYPDNQDYSMLFVPGINGNKLQFVFTSFAIEAEATCNKDYLRIFDGVTKYSPLIDTFCGTKSPDTITATNSAGAILFVFHSNASINQSGWSATFTCVASNSENPSSLTAATVSSSQVDLGWTRNPDKNDVMLAWSSNGTFGVPQNGTSYTIGELIPGGGIILAKSSDTIFNHIGLNSSTIYYYKAFSYDADNKYSAGITANATTLFQPSLWVDKLSRNVLSPAGSISANIFSNTDWIVSSDQAWCTVASPGTGDMSIAVNYEENLSTYARVAIITFTVTGLSPVELTLTQAGAAPVLEVTPPLINVNAYAASVDYTVASNTIWTVVADSAWCTVTEAGSGDGIIHVIYPWNPYNKDRSTTISVNATGISTQIVTLMQGHETASVPGDESGDIRIYPNPSRGLFSILVDKLKYPEMLVTITDMKGVSFIRRECKGESEYLFDLGKSPQGTYIVKISTESELLVTKMVVIK
jgi:PKD repeat protein